MSTKTSRSKVLGKRDREASGPRSAVRIEDPEVQNFVGRMKRRWRAGEHSDEEYLRMFREERR